MPLAQSLHCARKSTCSIATSHACKHQRLNVFPQGVAAGVANKLQSAEHLVTRCSDDEGMAFRSLVAVQAAPDVRRKTSSEARSARSCTSALTLSDMMACCVQVDTTGMALVDAQAVQSGQTHQIPGTDSGTGL